eukprot:CAMPEP_0113555772 /NCGR_PEP_ID=MMETSP0015_2-20120614/16900_1 /TAXON_ID=2838 /ORGANISM="Odontella" /LENGTH=106 /DNA_ID=CAMNT_0000457081 /DNA_START=684 /DNA_END=1004 /DNA_ORIENTATION=- /assembly_acc=CAM_ASM_000160
MTIVRADACGIVDDCSARWRDVDDVLPVSSPPQPRGEPRDAHHGRLAVRPIPPSAGEEPQPPPRAVVDGGSGGVRRVRRGSQDGASVVPPVGGPEGSREEAGTRGA